MKSINTQNLLSLKVESSGKKMTRKRNKNLIPLPEGVEINKTVKFYLNGWRFGRLDKVEGNEAGIHIGNYAHPDAVTRLKWVPIADIRKVDE